MKLTDSLSQSGVAIADLFNKRKSTQTAKNCQRRQIRASFRPRGEKGELFCVRQFFNNSLSLSHCMCLRRSGSFLWAPAELLSLYCAPIHLICCVNVWADEICERPAHARGGEEVWQTHAHTKSNSCRARARLLWRGRRNTLAQNCKRRQRRRIWANAFDWLRSLASQSEFKAIKLVRASIAQTASGN
jgi:hypothetical protein